MSLLVTIVRHGNTFAPGEPVLRIGARCDPPLTPAGEAQARALGSAFADARFTRVLASPLRRTRRTAELIVGEGPDAPAIEPCDWLVEIDHGPDEGRAEYDVRARLGEAALDRWDREAVAPADWRVDAPRRTAAWARLLREATGHLLAVSSNGAARFVFAADPVLARAAAALPSLKLRTGAWGRIAVEGGAPRLLAWDQRP